jgi:hypothetical protein
MHPHQNFRSQTTALIAKATQAATSKNKTTVTTAQRFPMIGKKRMKVILAKLPTQQDLTRATI